jgi:hypothetical protein
MKKEAVPQSILEKVEQELLAGETLLWVGLPTRKYIPSNPYDNKATAAFVLGMLVSLLAGYLVASRAVASVSSVFIFMALTLLALGAALYYAVLQNMQGYPQLYAVTNRRALILTKNRVQSFAADDIHFIERNMHRDGTGDIIFREEHYKRLVPVGKVVIQKGERITTGFYGIDNPTQVEALMLETFRDHKQAHHHLEDNVAVLYDGSQRTQQAY